MKIQIPLLPAFAICLLAALPPLMAQGSLSYAALTSAQRDQLVSGGSLWTASGAVWGHVQIDSAQGNGSDAALDAFQPNSAVPIVIGQTGGQASMADNGPGFGGIANTPVAIGSTDPVAGFILSAGSVGPDYWIFINSMTVTVDGNAVPVPITIDTSTEQQQFYEFILPNPTTDFSVAFDATVPANQAGMGFASTFGVTALSVSAVPEPSSISLIAFGFAICTVFALRTRPRTPSESRKESP